jgi:AhpD family alkylhydroperoxidase
VAARKIGKGQEARGEREEGGSIMDQTNNVETGLFAELRKLSPKVTGGLLRMRQEAYRDGVVPAKYKLLTAMAISITIRCEPCIRAYVQMAVEKGISQEELIEFLEVAMTMQGCPGEEWSLKAYKAYKEYVSGTQPDESNMCCGH